jgi:hypothetical protein
MASNIRKQLLAAAGLLVLTACGGGGGGGNNFTPPPPVSPPPPPPSANANPLSAAPLGVTSTTDLTTIGSLEDVRWNAQAGAYEVQIGTVAGKVAPTAAGPYAQGGDLVAADGSKLPYTIQALTGFDYTRLGHIASIAPLEAPTYFAFGVATPSGSVPTTGTATYDATIDGRAGSWPVYGTAQFQFDFGAGKLSGYMDPHTNGPMESPALPRYNFTNTVFSAGSTTFSGSFDVAGPTPSSFHGQFTGPQAQELMATFTAPFLDWDANEMPNTWGVMEGVIAGRRH